jgi:hypothetical protein
MNNPQNTNMLASFFQQTAGSPPNIPQQIPYRSNVPAVNFQAPLAHPAPLEKPGITSEIRAKVIEVMYLFLFQFHLTFVLRTQRLQKLIATFHEKGSTVSIDQFRNVATSVEDKVFSEAVEKSHYMELVKTKMTALLQKSMTLMHS